METTEPDAADQRFAAGIRRVRERAGLSQGALAEKMAAAGFPFRQQTVSEIESGQRAVRMGEGLALARVLDVTVESLTRPEGVAWEADVITQAKRDLIEALAAMDVQHKKAAAARGRLERAIRSAQSKGVAETLAREIRDARRLLEREF